MKLQLHKFEWSEIFRAFLDMMVFFFHIFDHLVKNCKKNLIPMMHKLCQNVSINLFKLTNFLFKFVFFYILGFPFSFSWLLQKFVLELKS